jgi:hypothetical protein
LVVARQVPRHDHQGRIQPPAHPSLCTGGSLAGKFHHRGRPRDGRDRRRATAVPPRLCFRRGKREAGAALLATAQQLARSTHRPRSGTPRRRVGQDGRTLVPNRQQRASD